MLDTVKKRFSSPFAISTSSGTASVHVSVAASEVRAGAEVITSPITDVGTTIAILYQNAIPVFADVDPATSNVTAATIEAQITDRTEAVIVVHLAGSPADIGPIAELCAKRKITLIEDCAQALGATYAGRPLGRHGRFGCYSLNNQKHITAGEGGFVLMGDQTDFYRAHNIADKYYDRFKQGVMLQALGLNYRMSELQGAVGLAQFGRLDGVAARRKALGDRLTGRLKEIPGVISQVPVAGASSSYFFFLFRIDASQFSIGRDEFMNRLKAAGVPAHGAYLPWPLYRAPLFANKNFFPGGVWPAELIAKRTYDYASVKLPGTELAVATTMRLPLHEGFTEAEIDLYADAIRKVADGARATVKT
jgi:dTDP-4-amino-4,6-dideoxygalactose transaminase